MNDRNLLKLAALAALTAGLAACGGSSGGGVVDAGPAPDSFFVAVNAVIATTSEAGEPREIDSIAATSPENTEPSEVGS